MKLRGLLVEHSVDDAELMARELRRAGHELTVRRVDTEDELRTALEAGSWDVAVCDWSLPAFSARRAIEVLRQTVFEGPIIVVSGTGGEEIVVEAMRSGADDFIVKDDLSRLSSAVERGGAVRTTTRRAEGRLAAGEARLSGLLDSIPASVYVVVASDSTTGYDTQYISPQIAQMIGYSPEELVREPDLWRDILHPDDRARVLHAEKAHLDSGTPLRQEYRIFARDGRIVWVRDEAVLLPGEEGRTGVSHGILSDITESKVAEEALRRQALIFENVNDAVVIVDLDGRILDFNPGAEVMFGYSKDEARGRVPDFLSGADADIGLTETVLSTVAREGRWSGEVPVPRGDGALGVAELVVVPLKDPGGGMLGTVGVLRDVTERKRSEEELRRTIDLLRASDQERRQLVSRLVTAREEEAQRIAGEIHDDPIQQLSAAALRLGMLRTGLDETKRSQTLAQVDKAVNDTLSRLRRMLFELSPRTLETDGLGTALDEYVQHANQEGATTYHLQDELGGELGQEKRTIAYRVVLEALSNVRKHAAARNATVRLEDTDGDFRCSVTDDGKGIAPEDLGVSLPGHMGTATMRQRVEMAGGWIEITSKLGEGTTVEFWLPRDEST